MDSVNAFLGKPDAPSSQEITTALGKSIQEWKSIIQWAEEHIGTDGQEWKSSGAKYGWSLRLLQKKRRLIYLSPCQGCFLASLVLGDKAMKAINPADLPPAIVQILREAPKYAEGTGIRIFVHAGDDMIPIQKLLQIKAEH